MRKHICIIYLWSLFPLSLWAQDVSVNKIKAAYLFQFAQNTAWENENALKTFKLGILGYAPGLYNELALIKKSYKLKGRSIELLTFKNIDAITDVQLLYLPNLKCASNSSALQKALKNNILMVTDRCDNSVTQMINFIYSKDNKIQFETNTQNISAAGLTINAKLLLLGGNESDVLELFSRSEASLRNEKLRASKFKDQLAQFEQELKKQKVRYQNQEELIKEQISLLDAQKSQMKILSDSIGIQENLYNNLQTRIEEQALTVSQQQLILNQKLEEIRVQTEAFNKNKQQLDSQTKKLDNLRSLITDQETKIDTQSNKLEKQVSTIELQKYGLISALIIIALILGMIFSFVRSAKIKKRTFRVIQSQNKELVDKQNEISLQNEELKRQKEELLSLTKKLEKQALQLQYSMHEVERANDEIMDINENLEKKIRQRTDQLLKMNKKLSDYTFMNAHNLSAPIANIKGIIQILDFELPLEEKLNFIDKLKVQTNLLDDVIREINKVLEHKREKYVV